MFILPLLDRWYLRQAEKAIRTETILPGDTINKELAHVLMRDDKAFEKFKEFTVRDLSVENPLFAKQVIKWRNLCLPKETIRAASSLGMDHSGLKVQESAKISNTSKQVFSAVGDFDVPLEEETAEEIAKARAKDDLLPDSQASQPLATIANKAPTSPTVPSAPQLPQIISPPVPGGGAKKPTLKPELNNQAIEIFKAFIEDNARMEINITNDTKRKIIYEMRLNNITANLFDQALVEICMLMHTVLILSL